MTLHEKNTVPTAVVEKRKKGWGKKKEKGNLQVNSGLKDSEFTLFNNVLWASRTLSYLEKERKVKLKWTLPELKQTDDEASDFCIRSQHKLLKKKNSASSKGNISEQKVLVPVSDHTHWEFIFQLKTKYYLIITIEHN